ncbi:MAG: cysteine--tRNA ligase [Pseudomonadota bacterium]
MPIHLYNSATRTKSAFTPQDPNRVTLYVCGPTVYNFAHIGNARPPVVFDVLRRLLVHHYGPNNVVYARNITDIDDKIIAKADAEGTSIETISERYEAAYLADMATLGVMPPDLAPHATMAIGDITHMIAQLIDQGHAYAAQGHVLFKVESLAEYGALSGRNRDEMIAGARVEVAPYKADPADFVLWKPSSDDQPGWDSPWGRGRPGWHIECSAMIKANLGETIDIHGGGIDLIFPHHENEAAQSCCAHGGAPLARFWMHNGFVNMNAEKMSKSLGNVLLVHDLAGSWPGEVLRYVLLSAQYRQPLDWTEAALQQAKATLDRLYRALEGFDASTAGAGATDKAVLAALEDDLNTPKALAELSRLAGAATNIEAQATLRASARLLGLLQGDAMAWRHGSSGDEKDAKLIESLIAQRAKAKQNRDFKVADQIRNELADKGIILEDGPGGTTWRRK